jgi:DNA-binding transcriptional ArsR family regulator
MIISRYIDIIMMPLLKQMKALGDDTRLVILDMLRERELSVGDIVDLLDMGQSRISRHLKILHDAGLVTLRKDGLWSFYRVEGGSLPELFFSRMDEDETILTARDHWQERMSERAKEKALWFDALAPELNGLKKEIFGSVNPALLVSDLLPSGHSAADLGCGTGELLSLLHEKCSSVIGVDYSREMLSRAGKSAGIADLRLGSLEHLPMRDREVHTAILSMVLHYLPEPQRAIEEAGRVVEDKGSIIICDLEKHTREELRQSQGHRWLGFDPQELGQWLGDAGFRIVYEKQYDVQQNLKILLISANKS